MLNLGLGWRVGIYALLAGLTAGYVKGCTDERVRGAKFEGAVAAVGRAQEDRARETGERNLARKKVSDDARARLRNDYDKLAVRLRDARAGRSVLPPAAPDAKRPAVAAFDRAELDRALRELDAEVRGIVEEGDRARIDLDTVKKWVHDENPTPPGR